MNHKVQIVWMPSHDRISILWTFFHLFLVSSSPYFHNRYCIYTITWMPSRWEDFQFCGPFSLPPVSSIILITLLPLLLHPLQYTFSYLPQKHSPPKFYCKHLFCNPLLNTQFILCLTRGNLKMTCWLSYIVQKTHARRQKINKNLSCWE